jgi:hypothetical protein
MRAKSILFMTLFTIAAILASPRLHAEGAAAAKVDDTPSIKIGSVIFTDYTRQLTPTTKDSDGNDVQLSSFNVSRAYLNLTGQLNHRITFRITPEAARESGAGSSLSGSQTFRLKYAFAQLNLEEWLAKGAWLRVGMQQTPLIDYEEQIYRYRFQGPTFADREGYAGSSDAGLSAHYELPKGHGDVHAGIYNGEGFNKAEANGEKSLQVRTSFRPLPENALWKGLRVTAFYNGDHFVRNGEKQRLLEQVTFEHARFNAGFDHLQATDQTSAAMRAVESEGWSVWVTPRLGHGYELLFRHDEVKPDQTTSLQRTRDIVGAAYWVPNLQKISAALLLDYDSLQQKHYATPRPRDTRYAMKLLVQF